MMTATSFEVINIFKTHRDSKYGQSFMFLQFSANHISRCDRDCNYNWRPCNSQPEHSCNNKTII